MKEYSRKFYESKSWQNCREAYLTGQQYICERCGGIASIAHHRAYITPENINDPFITLCFDNLEAICYDCHNKEHSRKPERAETEKRYTFTADGELSEGKKVYLVTGCHGSGKTHYVKSHMKSGDLIVDLDAILQAISYKTAYNAPKNLLTVALETRKFLYVEIAKRRGQWMVAWVMEALPGKRQRIKRAAELGAENIHIISDLNTCLANIERDSARTDKELWRGLVNKYWAEHEP